MRSLAIACVLAVAAAVVALRRRVVRGRATLAVPETPPAPRRVVSEARPRLPEAPAPATHEPAEPPRPATHEPPEPAAPAPPTPSSRFRSVPWTLVAAHEDPPRLDLRCAPHGRGAVLDRVDVQETPTQVFVTVLVRAQPPAAARAGGPALPGDPEPLAATVALAARLGDRELVHAPVDPEPEPPRLYP